MGKGEGTVEAFPSQTKRQLSSLLELSKKHILAPQALLFVAASERDSCSTTTLLTINAHNMSVTAAVWAKNAHTFSLGKTIAISSSFLASGTFFKTVRKPKYNALYFGEKYLFFGSVRKI